MNVYQKDFPMESLNGLVFSREPLHPDEILVACIDESIRHNMTMGKLMTNQAFLTWTDKQVERFPFEQMKGVDILEDQKKTWALRFIINGRLTTLRGIPEEGFWKPFVNILDENKITYKKEYNYKLTSFQVDFLSPDKHTLNKVLRSVLPQQSGQPENLDNIDIISGGKGTLNIYPTHLEVVLTKTNRLQSFMADQILDSGTVGGLLVGSFYKSQSEKYDIIHLKWEEVSWIKFVPEREEIFICAVPTSSDKKLLFVGKSHENIDLLRKLDKYVAVEGIPVTTTPKRSITSKKPKGPGMGLAIIGLVLSLFDFALPLLFILSIPLCIYVAWKAKEIIPKIIAILGILISVVITVFWAVVISTGI